MQVLVLYSLQLWETERGVVASTCCNVHLETDVRVWVEPQDGSKQAVKHGTCGNPLLSFSSQMYVVVGGPCHRGAGVAVAHSLSVLWSCMAGRL